MSQPIWTRIGEPEFDYQTLMHVLQDYAKPRDKVTSLIKQGVIRRIKKGIYVFGEGYERQAPSPELLSNLIYGPSYISLDYALQHHGLIPERVKGVTAVCLGTSRKFETPLGLFTYHSIPVNAYNPGIVRMKIDENRSYLMADAEKALVDKVKAGHGTGIRTQNEMHHYLQADLRVASDRLLELDAVKIKNYAQAYSSFKLQVLAGLIRSEQRGRKGHTNE